MTSDKKPRPEDPFTTTEKVMQTFRMSRELVTFLKGEADRAWRGPHRARRPLPRRPAHLVRSAGRGRGAARGGPRRARARTLRVPAPPALPAGAGAARAAAWLRWPEARASGGSGSDRGAGRSRGGAPCRTSRESSSPSAIARSSPTSASPATPRPTRSTGSSRRPTARSWSIAGSRSSAFRERVRERAPACVACSTGARGDGRTGLGAHALRPKHRRAEPALAPAAGGARRRRTVPRAHAAPQRRAPGPRARAQDVRNGAARRASLPLARGERRGPRSFVRWATPRRALRGRAEARRDPGDPRPETAALPRGGDRAPRASSRANRSGPARSRRSSSGTGSTSASPPTTSPAPGTRTPSGTASRHASSSWSTQRTGRSAFRRR